MDQQPTSSAKEPARYWVRLPDGLVPVRALHGTEGLSAPFRFELQLRMERGGDSLTADSLSRCGVLIGLHRGKALQRVLRGLITEIKVGASLEETPEVFLVVEPHLALLRHRTDCRIFRDKTVPEIVDLVLAPFEWRAEWRLQDSYVTRPYTVQFGESDLDFIHRLLEDEGIFYFVPDWSDLDEEDDNPPIVVCCDHVGAYDPIVADSVVPFAAAHGLGVDHERVSAVGPRQELSVSTVSLRDFNADKPSLDMDVQAEGPTTGSVEYYDYPGKYAVPSEGQRKAGLMSEAFACKSSTIEGRTDCVRFKPGARFELSGAPVGVDAAGYAIRKLRHRWHQDDDSLELDFWALPETITYRPERVTPSPMLTTPLTGFVTGPEGSDIHCDEMGRVKVRFPWDRLQPIDDTVSYWIPVLQDNTGHSSAIPRVGWEVMVNFLEGDPDRPVVLGRLYNGDDAFPEPLPAGKTCSALQSLNSPGRDGYNQIRFDDSAGNEMVTLQAEKDQNVNVANDYQEEVLNTESNWIGGNETLSVGSNSAAVVGKDAALTVQGDQSTAIGGSQTTKVASDTSNDVSGSRYVTIGGLHYRRIANYDTVTTGVLIELVGGLDMEQSLKGNTTDSEHIHTLTVGGALVELARKDKNESAKTKRVETIGGLCSRDAGAVLSLRVDGVRTTTVGGSMSLTGDDKVLIEGVSAVTVSSAGASTYTGTAKVVFMVGGSALTLEGSQISIKSGTITLDGGGAAALLPPLAHLNP